jgi:hypothetical protein
MLGVKIAANLDVRFWRNHRFRNPDRGIRENGSTKQPLRPQMMQHNSRAGCLAGQLWAIRVGPGVPHPHGAGEMIETEP